MNVKIWAVEKLVEIRYKSKWKKCFEKKKKRYLLCLGESPGRRTPMRSF